MPNQIKTKIVDSLVKDIGESSHVMVTEYQGMNSSEFDELRSLLWAHGSKFKVVKNRLAKVALSLVGFNELKDFLKGASALAYQGNDGATIAKILFKFGEQHSSLKVRGGRIFGTMVDGKALKEIASLPSREILLATLLMRMNNPLYKIHTILNEPLRSLHAALSGFAKKMETISAQ